MVDLEVVEKMFLLSHLTDQFLNSVTEKRKMSLSFSPYIKEKKHKLFKIKIIANAGLHRTFISPPGSKSGEVHLGQPDK